jgi:predicted Zn-dependent protease with MMP-like domain
MIAGKEERMISIEEYRNIISELMDELPKEFFRDLSGGVIVSEALVIPDYARADDLYTLGQYQVASGIRQIIMFKGSFDRAYPRADAARAKELLRGILRHEFRHHLEFLGGIHNSDSLEAEDRRRKQAYLSGQ